MSGPDVTLLVVPHERFSVARRSLESLLENTSGPYELVYVDANSPPAVRRHLDTVARRGALRLVRTDRYLSPNQARNLGLREVRTRYVVFIDNDVLFAPGWLEPLVRCAEETRASIVGPLLLQGEWPEATIHSAGATFATRQEGGRNVFAAPLRLHGARPEALAAPLVRQPTDLAQFHCMLARTELFERIGPLDEQLLSTREHVDLCLSARAAGGSVYLEPRSVVTFLVPPPYSLSDVPYYVLRWSEAWNRASVRHFEEKWGLSLGQRWAREIRGRRYRLLAPLRAVGARLVGARAMHLLERGLIHPPERLLNRLLIRHPRRTVRPACGSAGEVPAARPDRAVGGEEPILDSRVRR